MNDNKIESNNVEDSNLSDKIKILEEEKKLLSERICLLEDEVKKNWEFFLRAKADFENLKKRTDKDIINITKYSNKKLLLELLPILDGFEGYISKKDEIIKADSFLLFYKMIFNILDKYDVKKIDVDKYSVFDPSKHEVISTVKDEEHDNVIASTIQSGYMLHDHVLRYAKVAIFKKDIDCK